MLSKLRSSLRRLFAKKATCWVCGKSTPDLGPESLYHGPLGGASGTACPQCRGIRADRPERAEWFMGLAVAGLAPPSAEYLAAMDAEGARCGCPIHVFEDGLYVPLLIWAEDERPLD
jgi:hypothetical protein